MGVQKYDREGRKSNYGVKWTDSGKRRFKFFENKSIRNDFYKQMVKQEKDTSKAILKLSANDAIIMQRCIDLLGSPEKVLKVCSEYKGRVDLIDITPEESKKLYLAEKHSLGRDINYYRAIRNVIERLIIAFPNEFHKWDVEFARKWMLELSGTFAPVTVKNHIKISRVFVGWCVERRYIAENCFSGVPVPDIIRAEPEFLSVGDMRKLLDVAKDKFPETLANFALGAFGGLRSSATCRLDIGSIDFEKRGILIRADQAKNKRRVYLDSYEDNLWDWLEYARDNAPGGFDLKKRRWDELRGRIAKMAGVEMPHNALRHSFCTYHVALHGDAGKTATLLTHRGNVSILYEHYKGNASKHDGKGWFGIVP